MLNLLIKQANLNGEIKDIAIENDRIKMIDDQINEKAESIISFDW